jgi:hypothetical protein
MNSVGDSGFQPYRSDLAVTKFEHAHKPLRRPLRLAVESDRIKPD